MTLPKPLWTAALLAAIPASLFAQSWSGLGGSDATSGLSATPPVTSGSCAIVLDSAGRPVVAWQESVGGGEVYLRRWDGSAWTELDGSGSGYGLSGITDAGGEFWQGPYLAIDGQDHPVVGWCGYADGITDIYLKQWNGSAWVGLAGSDQHGGISASASGALHASLAVDGAGRPTMSWKESGIGIRIKRYDAVADAWIKYEDITGTNALDGTSVAVDGAGTPTVAWVDYSTNQACLRQWDGATWAELGGSATGVLDSSGYAGHPAVRLDGSGRPVVAMFVSTSWPSSTYVYVTRWNGSTWDWLGGSVAGNQASVKPSGAFALAVDRSGAPHVAWQSGANDIYYRSWTGTEWADVAGSGVGGGVSNNSTISRDPALALNSSGLPYLAWSDLNPYAPPPGNQAEIMLRRPAATASWPEQWTLDGAGRIEPGALLLEQPGFEARATLVHPRGLAIRLQVEVAEAGTSFNEDAPAFMATGLPSPSGSIAAVALTQLLPDRRYHWRARGVDAENNRSDWMSFGAQPEDAAEVDVAIRSNAAPVIASSGQFDGSGTILPPGAAIAAQGGLVRFTAVITGDYDDLGRFEIEVVPAGRSFSGTPSDGTAFVASGETVVIERALAPGAYHWRQRAVDSLGKESAWSPFGSNGDADADFLLIAYGSTSSGYCSASGTGLLLLPLLAVFLLLRRR